MLSSVDIVEDKRKPPHKSLSSARLDLFEVTPLTLMPSQHTGCATTLLKSFKNYGSDHFEVLQQAICTGSLMSAAIAWIA